MSIKDDIKVTDSTRFLLRGIELLKPELIPYGFINAFVDDKDHDPHYEDCVYVLFKPPSLVEFEFFVESEKIRTHLFIEDYDYPNGYVVMVYKFPSKYMEDYRKFLVGKYSKFSKVYKDLFPTEKSGLTSKNIPYKEPSFYAHIFNKSDKMRDYWENRLGVELDADSEYWSSPTLSRETINIKDYE